MQQNDSLANGCRNCRSISNVGGGYDIGLKYNDASTYAPPKRPLSLVFDNCSVEASGDGRTSPAVRPERCPFGGGYQIDGPKTGTIGTASHCRHCRSAAPPLSL